MDSKASAQDAQAKCELAQRRNLRVKQTLQVIVQLADAIHARLSALQGEFPLDLVDNLTAATVELDLCHRRLQPRQRGALEAE